MFSMLSSGISPAKIRPPPMRKPSLNVQGLFHMLNLDELAVLLRLFNPLGLDFL